MEIDPTNPVVALCAAGMATEGNGDAARHLFEQAWDARRDDYDASIAAHFLARQQASVGERLHWNMLAAEHAELVADGRARGFKASLYLNLGDAFLAAGQPDEARAAVDKAAAGLADISESGYRSFVERGIAGLRARLA
jgi:hypothetical protein